MHAPTLTSPETVATPQLRLDQVTLVAASSVAIGPTVRALRQSMNEVRFGKVLLLSDQHPHLGCNSGIEWLPIRPISSRTDYSRFILHELAAHLTTSHALCVQWDGYVLNSRYWDQEFLAYDFIGAPWPHFADGHNVGNGGFSLRSVRFLESCRSLPAEGSAEDITVCRTYRKRLEGLGMMYAPEEVARRFSYERIPRRGDEFGFHGVFNMIDHVPSEEFFDIIQSLEPNVLSRREHRELLGSAVKRGQWRVAFAILRRIVDVRGAS